MTNNTYIPERAEAVVVSALVEAMIEDAKHPDEPDPALTLGALGFQHDDPDYYERFAP